MKKAALFFLIALVALGLLALPALVVSASPQPQVVYTTPTAMPDGRIVYKVKENDTCISISLLNKISLDDLRRLNNIEGADCLLRVGQELLLGIADTTPSAPQQPTASPTPLLPLGTAFNGKGVICVYLYDDVNGNGMAENGEPAIGGGAVSVNDRSGKTSLTGLTRDIGGPLCYKDIPAGEYTVSVAAPDGYNATTDLTYKLSINPGDTATLDFGAQISSAAKPVPVSEGGRSPVLGIVGGLLVVMAIALGVYFRTMRR